MPLDCLSLLTPDWVDLEVDAADRDAAIRAAARLLSRNPSIRDAEVFTQAVLARERLHSTALPNEVAFPHARSVVVQDVVVAAIRLRSAVDFDGSRVRLVFVIGTPPERTADHLALLAWLAKRMSVASVRDSLFAAGTPQEFCAALAGSNVPSGLASHA